MTSFPMPCPCTKCHGAMREFVMHFSGKWQCPVSQEIIEAPPEPK